MITEQWVHRKWLALGEKVSLLNRLSQDTKCWFRWLQCKKTLFKFQLEYKLKIAPKLKFLNQQHSLEPVLVFFKGCWLAAKFKCLDFEQLQSKTKCNVVLNGLGLVNNKKKNIYMIGGSVWNLKFRQPEVIFKVKPRQVSKVWIAKNVKVSLLQSNRTLSPVKTVSIGGSD